MAYYYATGTHGRLFELPVKTSWGKLIKRIKKHKWEDRSNLPFTHNYSTLKINGEIFTSIHNLFLVVNGVIQKAYSLDCDMTCYKVCGSGRKMKAADQFANPI